MTAGRRDDGRSRLVRDAMQQSVIGVVPEMTVRELIHVLLENSIAGAPVLDQRGKAIGVVSMTDVLRLAAHEAELPSGQLTWEPMIVPEEVSGDEDLPGTASPVPFTEPQRNVVEEASFDGYQVRDIMTPVAFTLSPADTLATAVGFLLRGRIHRALVADDGVLHGIITPFDVLEALEWH